MWNNEILIFNSALYTGTFIIFQCIKKKLTVGSFVLLLYAVLSVLSIDLFNSPDSTYNDLTLFPFIYLYVVLMLMFRPLLKFSEEKTKNIFMPDKSFMKLLSVVTITICTVYFILKIPTINFRFDLTALAENYINDHGGLESHKVEYGFLSALNVLNYTLGDIILLLFVYNLLFIKNRLITAGLIMSFVFKIIVALSSGSRGGIVNIMMDIPFMYVVFRSYMTDRLKKTIFKWLFIVFIAVSVPFFAITIGRLDGRQLKYHIESYVGQPFLNFNNYGLNAGGTREGDRTATLFKKMSGYETADNYAERRSMYSYMEMNDGIFYTFVGDFTLDYGPVAAFFILLSISFLFHKALSAKRPYNLGQILLFFLLYQICTHGFSLFTFSSFGGNLKLLLIIILAIVLWKRSKIQYAPLLKNKYSKYDYRKKSKSYCLLPASISPDSGKR
jgi:oligosaccharide repeat unit polymerase